MDNKIVDYSSNNFCNARKENKENIVWKKENLIPVIPVIQKFQCC